MQHWYNVLRESKGDTNAKAGLILMSPSNKILLGKRSETVNNPLTVAVIGGHLKKDESHSEGAERELREETGYDGPIGKLEPFTVVDDFYIFSAFVDEEFTDFDPDPEFAEENEWFQWFTLEEIPERDDLHHRLASLIEGHRDSFEELISTNSRRHNNVGKV